MGFHGQNLGRRMVTAGAEPGSTVGGAVDFIEFLYRALSASSSSRRGFEEKVLFVGATQFPAEKSVV